MQLLKANYEIHKLASWKEMAKLLEQIGRTCYKSNDLITDDSYERFLRGIIDRGHEAMIEHASFSVCFTVDRGITHECVRHRVASFAQESTRYCNYSKDKFGGDVKYIDIKDILNVHPVTKKLSVEQQTLIYDEWWEACEDAERHYLNLLEMGCPAEMARGVLNNSTAATLWITMNIREWRHFFQLRACDMFGKAHPQMKEVTVPLLKQLQSECPLFFGDLRQ